MKYAVVWSPDAENDLAAIWVDAAVTAAGDELDVILREDAHLKGESRHGRVRILFLAPLAIEFEVRRDDRIARVVFVWRTE
jgi:hypothetical protein